MAKKATEISEPLVADLLREARNAQARSLDDVAAEICVRRCFLEAIESSDFASLPKQTFAIGFVKAYAKSLNLDATSIAAKFKDELNIANANRSVSEDDTCQMDAIEKVSLNISVNKQHIITHKKWPAWLSPIAGLVGATASWMFISAQMTTSGWYAAETLETKDLEVQQLAAIQARYIEKDESNILAAPKSEDTGVLGDAAENDVRGSLFFSAANADVQYNEAVISATITLHANEDSWLQLSYADGSAMWSGVLRAGQDYSPRLMEDVFLTTSNAGGVYLVNGHQKLGPLGERGEIISDLALNDAIVAEKNLTEAHQAHSMVN